METCEKILFLSSHVENTLHTVYTIPFTHICIVTLSMLKEKFCLCVGCKESQFYSLPFGQTVASMY